MPTTTKKDLIESIAIATSQSQAAVRMTIQCFMDQLIQELSRGNRVEFRHFGVFEVRERAARIVRNPRTQEPVLVAPDRTVRFKAGRAMKQAIEQAHDSRLKHNGDAMPFG